MEKLTLGEFYGGKEALEEFGGGKFALQGVCSIKMAIARDLCW